MFDKNSIQKPTAGLYLDTSLHNQPKETYRYALNSVNETELGDFSFISNEESNEKYTNLPLGYTPIGKEYIGDDETVLFLVSDNNLVSEIGVMDGIGNYVTIVNDSYSSVKDKLNFKIYNQIEATYRLRRGCEKTIYFVDKGNRPRYFNMSKPEDFKNPDNTWNASKFNLQKTYHSVPAFQNVQVLESGGNLKSGSYNFAIQYLDESMNPTEWISTSSTVKIYVDLLSSDYKEINGSVNSEYDYLNFPITSKAIRVEVNNLDKDFLYYRLAIIESTSGTGQISSVVHSEVIPTDKNFYIYTGTNGVSKGTSEEILQFTDVIEGAEHIEQIENRLLLANTHGKQTDFCKLQKYASKIKADCIVKEINLNDITDPSNQKNPTHEFGGLGYMPGEIYSFGIVYLYEDGTTTPVYHIPGRAPGIASTTKFTSGNNVYPMSSNNEISSTYISNTSCSGDYWGYDTEGKPLQGKHVRHHRFPLRSEINLPLVTESSGEEQENQYYQLLLRIKGSLKTPIPCPEDNKDCGTDKTYPFTVRVNYKVDGENFFFSETVDPNMYATGTDTTYIVDIPQNSQYHSSNNFTDIIIEETDINGNYGPAYTYWESYFTAKPEYETSIVPFKSTVKGRNYKSKIMGIKFSGIELPTDSKEKIVGYYIVRNERTEFDKTIVDSGILTPSVVNSKYVSHGLLQPQVGADKLHKSVFGLIHPEHKFNNKEYVSYDRIIQEGNYKVVDRKLGKINFDDVYDGSSYDKKAHKDGNDDGGDVDHSPTSKGFDGWSLNIISRDNIVSFEPKSDFSIPKQSIQNRFYLDALANRSITDNSEEVYNIAADNKVGIIKFKQDGLIDPIVNNLPYVILQKDNKDSYSNFRVLPYYKETMNPIYFSSGNSETSIFNGDSYISPMRYTNTVYWDNRVAKRAGRTSVFKKVLGAFLIVLGGVLSLTGIGAAAGTLIIGAGVAVVGAGALLLSSGIKLDNYNKAYIEEYDKGLRQTTLDDWVDMFYNYRPNNPFGYTEQTQWADRTLDGPSDDTIQWIGDSINTLWFESSVNFALRNKFYTTDTPTYLDAPGTIESGNTSPIALWEFFKIYYANSNQQRYPISSLERHLTKKLLVFDDKRDDNKFYIGTPLGEYYNVNADYMRHNKEKIYTHLPLEYDCCSDCKEKFPHRVHYSEQSFQEELSDNYRIFLPNNYRDLEGETGPVTNLIRLGNDLYVHTKEALWMFPRNYQERVTDQIVSFIGTGSYFEIPPRKVIDDDTGISGGLQHKWSAIKTQEGYFFVSEKQTDVFQFTTKGLKPISGAGLTNWFNSNLPVQMDQDFLKNNKVQFPFKDNPSNLFGTGFIMAHDSVKDRIILTKKDYLLEQTVLSPVLCTDTNGRIITFPNYDNVIKMQGGLGYFFEGLVSCQMLFSKQIKHTKTETRYGVNNTPISTIIDYYVPEYKTIDGIPVLENYKIDNSWTISYSLKKDAWVSFHSYLPNFYITAPNKHYSWIHNYDKENNYIWQHNSNWNYCTYYGKLYPHVLEYVSNENPTQTKVFNHINLITEAKEYDEDTQDFVHRDITFNKGVLYNTRQCSGEFILQPKDINENYLEDQVINENTNVVLIDRREKDWYFNDLRDIRIDYNKPIWNSNVSTFRDRYYTDKVLNTSTMDVNKDWTQLESFRDKYLVIRLIFDNFANIKLITNYSVENDSPSFH